MIINMKTADKLNILDGIDDKFITEAFPHRLFKIGAVPKKDKTVISERHPARMIESFVSVAAIFLVIGMIFVWTLVGKDIINAYHGEDTTNDMTTTEPQTTPTPATTTDNGIVPPIPNTDTTTKPWHTTAPITTTQPPVTVEPKPNPNSFDPKIVDFDHLWNIGYDMGWPTEKLYSGIAYRIQDTNGANDTFSNLEDFVEKLPLGILSQSFYSADQIDFRNVMLGMLHSKVTNEDELQKVVDVVMATNSMDKIELMAGGSIYKITTEDINEILAEHFHATFTDEMKKALKENTFYFEEYDAYYAVMEGNFTKFYNVKVEKAWIAENGNLIVSVSNGGGRADAKASKLSIVVLKNSNDQWIIDQVMYISKETVDKLYPNADTSIFDDEGALLRLLKESELKIDSLILEDWSEEYLEDIFDLLTTKGIGYALVRDYSGDPLNISVGKLINAAHQYEMTNEELKAYLKIRYDREKATNEDFDLTFEDYYDRMYGFDFSWCTSAELSANLQKFFGISFTDEIKEYCDSQEVYVQEFDKYVTYVEMSFLFVEFEVYKISTGQVLLIIPDFDGDSYNNSAKAVVLSSSGDGYVISQIATLEY